VKILIVDDEKMIRNWLTMLLRQIPDKHIEIATAGNVDDALEYCNQQEVHLVLTDITMPQRNGLELLQILRQTHPEISTAVLSAYNDYQYIRSAMQLGAIDYILKSEMRLTDLLSVLRKVELFSEDTTPQSAVRETPHQSSDYSLLDFLDNTDSLTEFLASTAPNLSLSNLMVDTLAFDGHQDIRHAHVLDICNKTLASEGVTGCSYYAQNVFWVIYNTGQTIMEHQKEVQQKISLLLERNLRMLVHKNIHFEAIDTASDPDSLRLILNRHLITLQCRQYYSAPPRSTHQFVPLKHETLTSIIKEIRFRMETHCYADAAATLKAFLSDSHQNFVFPLELKTAIHHCITIIFLNTPGLKNDILFSSRYQNINRQLNLADTSEVVAKLVGDFCTLYENQLQNIKKPTIHPSLKKAVDYIGENYMYRLTLEDVAAHIYLNKTYISQMFMKHLGISFGNYLESVRIHKAQELLQRTEESITRIAEKTGYASQSYFTKVFKKRVGMSPLKYRTLSQATAEDK